MKIFEHGDRKIVQDVLVGIIESIGTWYNHHSYLGICELHHPTRSITMTLRDPRVVAAVSMISDTIIICEKYVQINGTVFPTEHDSDKTALTLAASFNGYEQYIYDIQKKLATYTDEGLPCV